MAINTITVIIATEIMTMTGIEITAETVTGTETETGMITLVTATGINDNRDCRDSLPTPSSMQCQGEPLIRRKWFVCDR